MPPIRCSLGRRRSRIRPVLPAASRKAKRTKGKGPGQRRSPTPRLNLPRRESGHPKEPRPRPKTRTRLRQGRCKAEIGRNEREPSGRWVPMSRSRSRCSPDFRRRQDFTLCRNSSASPICRHRRGHQRRSASGASTISSMCGRESALLFEWMPVLRGAWRSRDSLENLLRWRDGGHRPDVSAAL